ncbi:hypothetical protein U1839_07190 [Sphingomonas sp. RT2P30]|uniref:hypothetical protein n=1 Tax=Parasphingomonas halimpatiens TaxID=3096162 RepID=UPI002FCBF61B
MPQRSIVARVDYPLANTLVTVSYLRARPGFEAAFLLIQVNMYLKKKDCVMNLLR